MKTKKLENMYPSTIYSDNKSGVKLTSHIYDDSSGHVIVSLGSEDVYIREDAKPKDWL